MGGKRKPNIGKRQRTPLRADDAWARGQEAREAKVLGSKLKK